MKVPPRQGREKPLTGTKGTAQQRKWWGDDVIIVSAQTHHSTLPKINHELIPPDTFWVYSPKNNLPMHLFTTMPGSDVNVAWTNCGGCMNPPYSCACVYGIRVPRSVEYIYDRNVAAVAGEEWSIHHPNYYGSILKAKTRAAEVDARKTLERRGIITAAAQRQQKADEQKALSARAEAVQPAKKRPRVKVKAVTTDLDDSAAATVDDQVKAFIGEKKRPKVRRK